MILKARAHDFIRLDEGFVAALIVRQPWSIITTSYTLLYILCTAVGGVSVCLMHVKKSYFKYHRQDTYTSVH